MLVAPAVLTLLNVAWVDEEQLYSVPFTTFWSKRALEDEPGWRRGCQSPLLSRVGVPVDVEMHRFRGDKLKPELVVHAFTALESMPPAVQRRLERHVCAIVFTTDMAPTGQVRPFVNDATRAVIFLSIEKMIPANAWMDVKEQSPYVATAGVTIDGTLASAEDDTVATLMAYAIAHELGHVLYEGWPTLPELEPFRALDHRRPPELIRLWYYPWMSNRPPLPISVIPKVFSLARAGGYPSLVAATNELEDFADSFALYVHSVMLGRPWSLVVKRDGKVIQRLDSCWDEPRCARRRRILESVLQ